MQRRIPLAGTVADDPQGVAKLVRDRCLVDLWCLTMIFLLHRLCSPFPNLLFVGKMAERSKACDSSEIQRG